MANPAPSDRPTGAVPDLFPWLFPAMLGLTALDVLLSGRDLTQTYEHLERSAQAAAPLIERGALQVWAQRAVSLLLVAATLQRIGRYVLHGRPLPAPLLSAAFIAFWVATVAAPALFGAQARVSHEYAYPLLLGLACTLVEPRDHERILILLRDALFVFMAAGLPLLLVQPVLVVDWGYTQGLVAGLPRYGGLALAPVMMGLLAQVALLLLWTHPFKRQWLLATAWVLGLAILVFAQSKTAWLSFVAGGACIWIAQSAPGILQGLGDPRRTAASVSLCLCVIAATVTVLLGTLVLDLPGQLEDFLSTREGAQLASLTGRDQIWAVAMEEWRRHPVFGYGLPMWNAEYRHEVGMPQATHAHNQFVDTLGRAGLVGATGLVLYGGVLLWLTLRHARAGSGLGLAMGVSVALLCVSEVPLLLIDYGSHLLQHYMLAICLASAACAGRVPRRRPYVPSVPGRPVPRHVAWPLPSVGARARKTLLASTVPVLLAVASPLSSGVPQPGDWPATPGLAFVAGIDPPLRLALAADLNARAMGAAPSSAGEEPAPQELVLERRLQAAAAAR